MYFTKRFNRYWLDLEITNHCSAKCIICDRKSMEKYGLGFMDKKTYLSILKKWVNFLKIISFWWIGDCFLHKDFFLYLDYLTYYIDKNHRKKDLNIFIYSKLQNIDKSKLLKIKSLQDRWYKIILYVSIFSFRRKIFEEMTWIKYDIFIENFKLINILKINFKINFTLTKYNIDDLPFLIKNFNNYQIETVHNFWWNIDISNFKNNNMKNIEIFSRNINQNSDNQFMSFCIAFDWEFRLSDEDSSRNIKIWNINKIWFKEASEILDKINLWKK